MDKKNCYINTNLFEAYLDQKESSKENPRYRNLYKETNIFGVSLRVQAKLDQSCIEVRVHYKIEIKHKIL